MSSLDRASEPAQRHALLGARLGGDEAAHAATLFGTTVELIIGADPQQLAERDAVHVLIGGFDAGECQHLSGAAESAGLLFLNIGCSSDALRGAECRRGTFHVAASDAMRRDAAALAGASASKTVELWHHSLQAFGAGQVNARFRHQFGIGMDSAAWSAWMAVKVAAEAAFRSKASEPRRLIADLERPMSRFDGHKGRPLSFRQWDHQLRQPLYLVEAGDPQPRITEVPARGANGRSAADQLDAIGTTASGSTCRWET